MLFTMIAVVLVAAVLLWALTRFPALDPTLVQIVRVIVIAGVALYAIAVLFALATGHRLFAF
jgi:hypothetical protein